MSKFEALNLYAKIREYNHLISMMQEAVYSHLLDQRNDLIDAVNEIIEIFEMEIERIGEELEGILFSEGLSIDDLHTHENFNTLV